MFLCAIALGCLPMVGCDGANSAPARSGSHLIVLNQTGFEWRLTVSSPKGTVVPSLRVAARSTIPVNLPAGDFVIEQVLLSATGEADVTRRIPVQLKAGQTYRWQLATLWSESDSVSGEVDWTRP